MLHFITQQFCPTFANQHSLRVDEWVAKRATGVKLGKPRGTVQESKFDAQREKIAELLGYGVSVRRIAYKHLGLKSHNALNTYIQKRKLRPQ